MVIIEKIKEFYLFILLIFVLFLLSLSFEYINYKELKKEELFETKVEVLNIYEKKEFLVLKLKASNFEFFTSINKDISLKKLDHLNLAFLSNNLNFYTYLKGFYVKTIYYEKVEKEDTLKDFFVTKIEKQHKIKNISELFQALFLAIPISKDLREVFSSYGISHLIALSGFHLAVLSFLIYIIFYYPYSYIHSKYFPYRNKKFDILLFSLFILFIYLIFTNIVPSLLRAFVMLLLSVYLLRSNIKLFSFYTLFLVFILIICLFPKYIFSLGLWFSFFGVFYIFLFIQYFKDIKNRFFQVVFFNFWIFFAINPIIHYFFAITSYEQLLSPIITIFFTIFYPIELFLHFIDYGGLFDMFLEVFINKEIYSFEKSTSFIFLFIYMVVSILSIVKKGFFYLLNLLSLIFLFYLYAI